MIKKLKIDLEKCPKKKRQRPSNPVTLAPGRSTENFLDPASFFHVRQIRSSIAEVMKNFRKNRAEKNTPWQFAQFSIPYVEHLDQLKTRIQEMVKEDLYEFDIDDEEYMESEEEQHEQEEVASHSEAEDLDLIDSFDLDEEIESFGQEEEEEEEAELHAPVEANPDLASIQNQIPEFVIAKPFEYAILKNEQAPDASANFSDVLPENIESSIEMVLSMAGLCCQVLGKNYDVDYVRVDTKDASTFFLRNEQIDQGAVVIKEKH